MKFDKYLNEEEERVAEELNIMRPIDFYVFLEIIKLFRKENSLSYSEINRTLKDIGISKKEAEQSLSRLAKHNLFMYQLSGDPRRTSEKYISIAKINFDLVDLSIDWHEMTDEALDNHMNRHMKRSLDSIRNWVSAKRAPRDMERMELLGKKIEEQRFKLGAVKYIDLSIVAIFGLILLCAFWERQEVRPSNMLLWLFLLLLIAIILRNIVPFVLKTDITSVELIAYYLYETASRLIEEPLRRDKKGITDRLGKIKRELDLIDDFYQNYRPEQVRKLEAPLAVEIVNSLRSLNMILRKISHIMKKEKTIDSKLEGNLKDLAIRLCENPERITQNTMDSVRIVLDTLLEIQEDETFARPWYRKIIGWSSRISSRGFWVKFLIPTTIFLIPYFAFVHPSYEYWAGIVVLVILGWAAASR